MNWMTCKPDLHDLPIGHEFDLVFRAGENSLCMTCNTPDPSRRIRMRWMGHITDSFGDSVGIIERVKPGRCSGCGLPLVYSHIPCESGVSLFTSAYMDVGQRVER